MDSVFNPLHSNLRYKGYNIDWANLTTDTHVKPLLEDVVDAAVLALHGFPDGVRWVGEGPHHVEEGLAAALAAELAGDFIHRVVGKG